MREAKRNLVSCGNQPRRSGGSVHQTLGTCTRYKGVEEVHFEALRIDPDSCRAPSLPVQDLVTVR